jgi:hypothetical protein
MRTDLRWAPARRCQAATYRARNGRAPSARVALAALGVAGCAVTGCASTVGANASVAAATTSGAAGAPTRGAPRVLAAATVHPTATGTGYWTPWTPAPSTPAAPAVVPVSVIPGVPECTPEKLGAALEDSEGTAGHLYAKVVLTNDGAGSCQLGGYPQVTFLDATGTQFGAVAEEDDAWGPAEPVALAPGGSASAVLRVTQAGIQRGCMTEEETQIATALRVALPNTVGSVVVALPAGGITGCVSASVRQLLIGPLAS